ncbi:Holliday junction branch migration protein RuvA [Myxococcota bacterium]|nr:Holliday junction branch migration protein RuvA [Myxococcota bacterium]MBU1381442.1 Holliday junction branch migration protein RuvA [Myxococcota bacterium]MBU1496597.1 Holliday junction branch migration protein RuvA [Myxococcota bacterium]
MIALLKGYPFSIDGEKVIFLAGNVGYELNCSKSLVETFSDPDEKTVYVYTHFSEHNTELFAFENGTEKRLFKKLITVNGIGPKAAMALINTFGVGELVSNIYKGNEKAICRAPGIGTKTAQRLIVDLRDFAGTFRAELPADMISTRNTGEIAVSVKHSDSLGKTLEALRGLGYKPAELQSIESQLSTFENEGHNLAQMIRYGLDLLRKDIR